MHRGMEKRLPFYKEILRAVERRSTCCRKEVGALLINPKNFHIVSMGYNGVPPGMPHCNDGGCLILENHCISTLHAEVNALANLEAKYEELYLVCTYEPCINCTKMLMANHVTQCYYLKDYSDVARDLMLASFNNRTGDPGIKLIKV